MKVKVLDTVVLEKHLPDYGLMKGDIGAVVEVYEPSGVEVEFVTGAGTTQAVVTLEAKGVRAVRATEILAVRPLVAA